MSIYQSQYPDVSVDPLVKAFFEEFYRISDTPDEHETYADYFLEDATLIMGSKEFRGRADIIELRKSMWVTVAERRHSPLKVFPFEQNATELMLYGTVDYVSKTGESSSKDWAARAELEKNDGKVCFRFYQVYLDSAPAKK